MEKNITEYTKVGLEIINCINNYKTNPHCSKKKYVAEMNKLFEEHNVLTDLKACIIIGFMMETLNTGILDLSLLFNVEEFNKITSEYKSIINSVVDSVDSTSNTGEKAINKIVSAKSYLISEGYKEEYLPWLYIIFGMSLYINNKHALT